MIVVRLVKGVWLKQVLHYVRLMKFQSRLVFCFFYWLTDSEIKELCVILIPLLRNQNLLVCIALYREQPPHPALSGWRG